MRLEGFSSWAWSTGADDSNKYNATTYLLFILSLGMPNECLWRDRGWEQSVTVPPRSRRSEEEGDGWGCGEANTAVKTGVILQPRGSKVTDSPSGNNSCHPLFTGPRWLQPPPAVRHRCLTPSSGCAGWPSDPEGQVSLNWDNSQTRQRTHGNTLVSYYAVSALMWIHLPPPPPPSCFIAEVGGRPCLGRRSTASSQSTNADKLKVLFRSLPFWRKQLLQCSTKFWPF